MMTKDSNSRESRLWKSIFFWYKNSATGIPLTDAVKRSLRAQVTGFAVEIKKFLFII